MSKPLTRRSLTTLAATLAIALSTLAAATPALAQGKVAMLLPGSINDQSWNASGFGAIT
jgi:basic membrane protein A